jgi:hypothetical protein
LPALYLSVDRRGYEGTRRRVAKEADTAFSGALSTAHRYEPFISQDIHELIVAYILSCKAEIDAFYGALSNEKRTDGSYDSESAFKEAKAAVREAEGERHAVAIRIRNRLASLSVIEA